jgi:hypothetical protein
VGDLVGDLEGLWLGRLLGLEVGPGVGDLVGDLEGRWLGRLLGNPLRDLLGAELPRSARLQMHPQPHNLPQVKVRFSMLHSLGGIIPRKPVCSNLRDVKLIRFSNSLGTKPTIIELLNNHSVSMFVRSPSSVGNEPEKLFACKKRCSIVVTLQSSGGMLPLSLFIPALKVTRLVEKPISVGIDCVRLFKPTLKTVMFGIERMLPLIGPVRELLKRSKDIRLSRFSQESGILPCIKLWDKSNT